MVDSKRIDRKDAEVLGTLTATVSMALDGLSDVNAPSPNDNDALTWDAATSKWTAQAGGGGAAAAITLAYESTDTKCPVVVALDYTGDQAPKTVNNLYVDSTTGVLVSPGFEGPLTGNVTGNADTATTASGVSGVNLDDLADVTITSAASDEFLAWNGTAWVNTPRPGGAGAGVVQLFMDDTAIRPTSANNSYEVVTLSTVPVTTTAEVVDSVTCNNNTVLAEAYLYDTALGGTSIEGGVWDFTIWRSADSTALTSELRFNIHRVISGGATTVTVTGSGTSRTCTASGGTPFDAGDASATIDACGFVMTPLGLYPITGWTSATEVTIATPSGYSNEAGVAFSVWRRLFQATTGDINDTTPNYTRQEILSAQAAFACNATDKLGWIVFGRTTRTSNTAIAWTHNGTARYTHVHTPLVLRHNDLAGLQGGTTAEYYHLTSTQVSELGYVNPVDESSDTTCFPLFATAATGSQQPKTDAYLTYNANTGALGATRFNGLADAQVLTTAADTTTTLDGTYASDLLITGTAVMQTYNLGTASNYANGKRFTFYNGTPEFVGVLTTDKSVWLRIPPASKGVCFLKDNSTANGVWYAQICEMRDPGYGISAINEFNASYNSATGVNYESLAMNFAGSGTGARVNSSGSASGVSIIGSADFETGTTNTGYQQCYTPSSNMPQFGYGTLAAECTQSFCSGLSTSGEEYIGRFGLGNNGAGGAPTNGVYFVYDRATNGDFWAIKNINTTSNATTVTAVAPSVSTTVLQKLRLEVSSGGTRSDFWINDVQVSAAGGLATYLPLQGTALVRWFGGITKTAGTTERVWTIDYLWAQWYPVTAR